MTLCVIFPTNPLNPQQVDPDYAAEQQAAAQYFDTAVIDFDALVQQGQVHFSGLPAYLSTVLYRGWMLRPEQYPLLSQAVASRGGQLLTDTKAYLAAHLLPSWAEHPHTPKARWNTDLRDDALKELLNQFTGPVTVKDFVKSRKNEWDSAFYIPSAQVQTAALEVIHNFIERQGDLLVGGVVLREFVPFKSIGYFHDEPTYEEYRVF
nr:ATP-grasp domain-containing protein [Lactiplantibacillus fabifermentans]